VNSPHYDWSKVSPETAQKVLQAAHDWKHANEHTTEDKGGELDAAVDQARKEAAIYEITAAEALILEAAREFYNSAGESFSHSQVHEIQCRAKLFDVLHKAYRQASE
jgi:hypothetical protein